MGPVLVLVFEELTSILRRGHSQLLGGADTGIRLSRGRGTVFDSFRWLTTFGNNPPLGWTPLGPGAPRRRTGRCRGRSPPRCL